MFWFSIQNFSHHKKILITFELLDRFSIFKKVKLSEFNFLVNENGLCQLKEGECQVTETIVRPLISALLKLNLFCLNIICAQYNIY